MLESKPSNTCDEGLKGALDGHRQGSWGGRSFPRRWGPSSGPSTVRDRLSPLGVARRSPRPCQRQARVPAVGLTQSGQRIACGQWGRHLLNCRGTRHAGITLEVLLGSGSPGPVSANTICTAALARPPALALDTNAVHALEVACTYSGVQRTYLFPSLGRTRFARSLRLAHSHALSVDSPLSITFVPPLSVCPSSAVPAPRIARHRSIQHCGLTHPCRHRVGWAVALMPPKQRGGGRGKKPKRRRNDVCDPGFCPPPCKVAWIAWVDAIRTQIQPPRHVTSAAAPHCRRSTPASTIELERAAPWAKQAWLRMHAAMQRYASPQDAPAS